MDWLGLEYDEGPIFQTQRLDRYREVAEQMVAAGTAYYAYETKEELEQYLAMVEEGRKRDHRRQRTDHGNQLGWRLLLLHSPRHPLRRSQEGPHCRRWPSLVQRYLC